ncbi:MAG: formyltransferase family protein, partial [Schleiferiaceae bacterium]|nr:formyltransferase family protein [Schleiferiaceae bacterium]
MKKPSVVYMGTPDFAVEPLKAIVENGYDVKGVITVADKPSGRGQKMRKSPVKVFAEENNLNILQPLKLKDPVFLEQLSALKADIFVVIAFRMLPREVWQMPELGTFNIHGSLLPNYRGAAPINWALINGEQKTGVTSFFINEEIDSGSLISNIEVDIADEDNAGTLHDKLMHSASS